MEDKLMIKKILIFTTSMLLSANAKCDWGYIDIYNETGEDINVLLNRHNNIPITPTPTGEFKLEKGKMKPAKLGASKKTLMNVQLPDSYADITVIWTQGDKGYKTRRLIRPNSIYLRKNGEYLTWDHKDSLFPTEHKEKAR